MLKQRDSAYLFIFQLDKMKNNFTFIDENNSISSENKDT